MADCLENGQQLAGEACHVKGLLGRVDTGCYDGMRGQQAAAQRSAALGTARQHAEHAGRQVGAGWELARDAYGGSQQAAPSIPQSPLHTCRSRPCTPACIRRGSLLKAASSTSF